MLAYTTPDASGQGTGRIRKTRTLDLAACAFTTASCKYILTFPGLHKHSSKCLFPFRCRGYEVLYNLGVKRFRKKSRMRAAGVRFPNTSGREEAQVSKPAYTSTASTQTDPMPIFCLPTLTKENPRGVHTPSRAEVREKRTGIFQRQRSESPKTPSHLRKASELTRQRSSSVGTPVHTSTQNASTRRSLFEKDTPKGRKYQPVQVI